MKLNNVSTHACHRILVLKYMLEVTPRSQSVAQIRSQKYSPSLWHHTRFPRGTFYRHGIALDGKWKSHRISETTHRRNSRYRSPTSTSEYSRKPSFNWPGLVNGTCSSLILRLECITVGLVHAEHSCTPERYFYSA